MSTVTWDSALQGVTPAQGFQNLPPATYRLKPVAGEGKTNSSSAPMLSLTFEVASGPLAGRKAFHNENLPTGTSDSDKTRMAFFLGLMEAFGITKEMLGQWFAGQAVTAEHIDFLAKQLVASGRIIKATVRPQKSDPSRVNLNNFMADDGIEPEPPATPSAAPGGLGAPRGVTGAPMGGGFPGGPPAPGAGAPMGIPGPGQAPGAGAPQGLPLGGFPGSTAPQGGPAAGPEWAQQTAAAAQPPAQQYAAQQPPQQFSGPGQAAPAAQPQAAGMNQFQQPAQGQFPGQQFQGQVDPANFPPQGQASQQPAAQPQGGMPGMPAQQPAQGPAGLPQGGFPPVQGAPQASF